MRRAHVGRQPSGRLRRDPRFETVQAHLRLTPSGSHRACHRPAVPCGADGAPLYYERQRPGANHALPPGAAARGQPASSRTPRPAPAPSCLDSSRMSLTRSLSAASGRMASSGCAAASPATTSCWPSVAGAAGCSPSCGARCISQTAAHWSTTPIPQLPVRRWVLSLPIRRACCCRADRAGHAGAAGGAACAQAPPARGCCAQGRPRPGRRRHADPALRIRRQLEYLPGSTAVTPIVRRASSGRIRPPTTNCVGCCRPS